MYKYNRVAGANWTPLCILCGFDQLHSISSVTVWICVTCERMLTYCTVNVRAVPGLRLTEGLWFYSTIMYFRVLWVEADMDVK